MSSSSLTGADLTELTAAPAAFPPPFEMFPGLINPDRLTAYSARPFFYPFPRAPRYLNHPNGILMRSRIEFCRFGLLTTKIFFYQTCPRPSRTPSASPFRGHAATSYIFTNLV